MKKTYTSILFILFIFLDQSIAAEIVPAYMNASYVSPDEAVKRLESNGFDVLTQHKIGKKEKLTSILFTNGLLSKDANKTDRAFAAITRLLVDEENQVVSINNPVYFGKAFLQDDYLPATAKAVSSTLQKAFGETTRSIDGLGVDDISGFHFMMGMPHYQDMIVIAEGKCTDLVAKARSFKKGKSLIFEYRLADDRYLLGMRLGRRSAKFIKKIGMNNAQLLPYLVLVEDGKAKILDPKYYIAISYPLLSMSEFTKIATVPGAIEKDLSRPFR